MHRHNPMSIFLLHAQSRADTFVHAKTFDFEDILHLGVKPDAPLQHCDIGCSARQCIHEFIIFVVFFRIHTTVNSCSPVQIVIGRNRSGYFIPSEHSPTYCVDSVRTCSCKANIHQVTVRTLLSRVLLPICVDSIHTCIVKSLFAESLCGHPRVPSPIHCTSSISTFRHHSIVRTALTL